MKEVVINLGLSGNPVHRSEWKALFPQCKFVTGVWQGKEERTAVLRCETNQSIESIALYIELMANRCNQEAIAFRVYEDGKRREFLQYNTMHKGPREVFNNEFFIE